MISQLPKSRYWTADFGPPVANAERHLVEDLRQKEFRLQRDALEWLHVENLPESNLVAAGVDREALGDLRRVGLAQRGVNLVLAEPTWRLSALGAIIQARLR